MLSNYRRLQHYIRSFEEQVEQQASTKSKRNHVDLRLCRLCYKNKFADGIGRVCQDCRRRVCGNCGSFTRPKWDYKKNKVNIFTLFHATDLTCSPLRKFNPFNDQMLR